MTLFKAYDIRGLVPSQLGPADARRIGRAVSGFFGGAPIAVGRDARTHSPALRDALVLGLQPRPARTWSTSASSPRRCSTSASTGSGSAAASW